VIENKTLKTLEFDKVLNELKQYTHSEDTKELCSSIRPAESEGEFQRLLDETSEADRVLFEQSISPSFAVDPIVNAVELASKGGLLSIPDILKIGRCLRQARNIKQYLKKAQNIPLLDEMCSLLYENRQFEDRIYSSFLSETEIADEASRNLKEIRGKVRKLNAAIKTRLQSYISSTAYSKYLQDNIVTIRSDRYVIPVKSEFKGAITGLIHDQSASGSTIYIEPMQIVELNNELKTLLIEEQAEIEKILRGFSAEIGDIKSQLCETYNTIIQLDLIFARAQYARSMKAICPRLSKKGALYLKNARHPLIDPKKVVPVTVELKDTTKMLLITGPNTGGKTVTLKLIGLSVIMAMSGLFIPASEAELPFIGSLYCDIGDEQSIEQSLSTFSSHIKNIIDILGKMDSASLILFDELGAGTDPSEGSALAVSIAEYIINKGARSVITSHFNELKEYALTTKGIVTAAMDFDSETFAPTYRLIMDSVGLSNALKIASRLGLKSEIVTAAERRLSKEKRDFDHVLSSAEETRRKAEQIIIEAEADRIRAQEARREAEEELKAAKEARERLNEMIRRETKKLIEESAEEANEIIAELKEKLKKQQLDDSDIFEAGKLRKQLETMSAKYEEKTEAPPKPAQGELKSGDSVYVKSLDKFGKLIGISSRGEAEVMLGKINVKVKKGDYYKVNK